MALLTLQLLQVAGMVCRIGEQAYLQLRTSSGIFGWLKTLARRLYVENQMEVHEYLLAGPNHYVDAGETHFNERTNRI